MADPGSPFTSRQHLALYNLTEHLKALLQFPRAHVTGEISNVYHTAFALLMKGGQKGTPLLLSWSLCLGLAGQQHCWGQREDSDNLYTKGPVLVGAGTTK